VLLGTLTKGIVKTAGCPLIIPKSILRTRDIKKGIRRKTKEGYLPIRSIMSGGAYRKIITLWYPV
jgi:hypothetical protein